MSSAGNLRIQNRGFCIMAWFRKKDKTVDLTGKYDRHIEKMKNIKGIVSKAESVNIEAPQRMQIQTPQNQVQTSSTGNFNFLRDMASSSMSSDSYGENEESDEKRKKLAKRLADITDKLEDLSNQIYHLQQRVELLERKNKLGFE